VTGALAGKTANAEVEAGVPATATAVFGLGSADAGPL
jgi:hypothetical protein